MGCGQCIPGMLDLRTYFLVTPQAPPLVSLNGYSSVLCFGEPKKEKSLAVHNVYVLILCSRACGLLCCGKCAKQKHVLLPVVSPRSSIGLPESCSLDKGLHKATSDDDGGNPDGRRHGDAEFCGETCENPLSRRNSQCSASAQKLAPTEDTSSRLDRHDLIQEKGKARCRSAESEQSGSCSNGGSSPSSYEESLTLTVDGRASQGEKPARVTRVRVCYMCVEVYNRNCKEAQEVFDNQTGFRQEDRPFPAVKRVQTSEDFTHFSRYCREMPFTPPEGAQQMCERDELPNLHVLTEALEDGPGFHYSESRTVSADTRKPRTPNRRIPTSFQRNGSNKQLNRRSKKVADLTEPGDELTRMLCGDDMNVFEFERQRTAHRSLLKASQSHTWGATNGQQSSSGLDTNEVTECVNCGREFVCGPHSGCHSGEFCTPECFASKALATGRYGLLP
eukprot:gb/GECG01015886.1/.p1 GENE.gb/GECG01015886.1/~~gb/GECG01015886.1/.p1  ORF type:complete len:448 (+),score=39.32 gb/GECG01015886.1/:1-1344(+)